MFTSSCARIQYLFKKPYSVVRIIPNNFSLVKDGPKREIKWTRAAVLLEIWPEQFFVRSRLLIYKFRSVFFFRKKVVKNNMSDSGNEKLPF